MSEEKTSIWKTEITFRRKPKAKAPAPAPAAAEAKTSFWKKEIKIGRKSKATAPAHAPAAKAKTSVWKKEISFRRKPKAQHAASAPVAAEPAAAKTKTSVWKKEITLRRKPKAQAAAPAPVAAKAKTSVWKKEITLRRKPKQAEAPAPAPAAAEPKTSVWKKEITLRRKPKQAEAPEAPVAGPFEVEPALPRVSLPNPVESEAVSPTVFLPPSGAAPPAPPAFAAADDPVDTDFAKPTFDLDIAPEETVELPAARNPFAGLADWPGAAGDDTVEFEIPAQPEPKPEPSRAASSPAGPFANVSDLPPQRPLVDVGADVRGPFALPVDPAPAAEPLDEEPEAEETERETEREQKHKKQRLSRAERKARKLAAKARRRRESSHKAKKIVGLKIGASQLAAARVSNNGSAELVQVARQPLESGIVVAGELRDLEALAAALKSFFGKHKLPRRGVRLGLSNNRIGVRIFEISGIEDPEQLRNAIRFRAQETLPIPIEEAVLDYHVVAEKVADDGTVTRRVVLVVAYRDLIDRYVAACRKAGIRLMGIDLEAFALLRALGDAREEDEAVREEERNGLVVVSVGHERSTFAVSDGRVCEFTRVLDWGGFSLNVAIARTLDLTPVEAEPIKLGLSLADTALVPTGLTSEQADAARAAVVGALESFARDLVSSLRFYQSQPDSLGIREIVLTGGTADMPGLASELERLIGVYVRVGDPLARVKVARRVKQREQIGSLAAAIGLGIED